MADPNLAAYPLSHAAPATGNKGHGGLEMTNFVMPQPGQSAFDRAEAAEERRNGRFVQAKYGRVLDMTKKHYRTLICIVSVSMGAVALGLILWALGNVAII